MSNLFTPPKKIKHIPDLGQNAFWILGAFHMAAKKQGWSEDDIRTVTKAAKSSDYTNLCNVIKDHCHE